MLELTSFGALVALTIGLTEVAKRLGTNDKFLPLVSLAGGFALSFVATAFSFATLNLLTGIAVGLSAAGLFDQTKLLRK